MGRKNILKALYTLEKKALQNEEEKKIDSEKKHIPLQVKWMVLYQNQAIQKCNGIRYN